MQILNVRDVAESKFESPKGKFGSVDQSLSLALGRDGNSTDLLQRHPFDVEISTVPPGKANCPYHSHSAQWEFYHVLSGTGKVRHEGGFAEIKAGDFFLFKPHEAHQIINDGTEGLTYSVVADNPMGESCYYPDSKKWAVRSPGRSIIRSESLGYFDGEE